MPKVFCFEVKEYNFNNIFGGWKAAGGVVTKKSKFSVKSKESGGAI